ncbi:MAG: hypothetical protein H8D74_00020 [Chloroflexi bacterium]|nr:hypothetical protein [Chloroflexota bacterium]
MALRTLSDLESKLVMELEWQEKRLVTLQDVMDILGCSYGHARKLAHQLEKKRWLDRDLRRRVPSVDCPMTNVPLSRDTIPLDVEAYIERQVAMILRTDPALLEHEEGQAQVMKEIEAFRQQARQDIAPLARPTRVACKRCYFRMRHAPPMWRDYCLLGLVRRQACPEQCRRVGPSPSSRTPPSGTRWRPASGRSTTPRVDLSTMPAG